MITSEMPKSNKVSKEVNSDHRFQYSIPNTSLKNQIEIENTQSLLTKHVPRALHTHECSYTRSMEKHGMIKTASKKLRFHTTVQIPPTKQKTPSLCS